MANPGPGRRTDQWTIGSGGFNVRPVQMEQEDDGYTTQPVYLGAEPEEEYDHEDQYEDPDLNHWVDQGFFNGMVQAADTADVRFGRCFNCLEEGHRWRDCTKLPLLPELQGILDREALNLKGVLEAREPAPPNQRRAMAGKGTGGPLPRAPNKANRPSDSLPLLESRRSLPLAGPREPRLGPDRREVHQGPFGHQRQGELSNPGLRQET